MVHLAARLGLSSVMPEGVFGTTQKMYFRFASSDINPRMLSEEAATFVVVDDGSELLSSETSWAAALTDCSVP